MKQSRVIRNSVPRDEAENRNRAQPRGNGAVTKLQECPWSQNPVGEQARQPWEAKVASQRDGGLPLPSITSPGVGKTRTMPEVPLYCHTSTAVP